MKRTFVKAASTSKMLDAFRRKVDELENETIEGSTGTTADMLVQFQDKINEFENVESSTDACDDGIVDEGLEPVEGSEWGQDNIFMLIDYAPSDAETGMEGDEFYPMGKFYAQNIEDAEAQLEAASAAQAERLSYLSQPYVIEYNEYFDDGGEVYQDLDTLISQNVLTPAEVAENNYEVDEMGNPVFNSCDVEGASDLDDEEYIADNDIEDDYDPEFDSSEEDWEQIDKKSIRDSDGFLTDYTLYRNEITGLYVCVYGDSEVYRPEDGYFDFETENYDEAIEWFNSYSGDEEDY